MGREIRKVPANWQHPRWTADNAIRPALIGKFQPLFDADYESAAQEWITNFALWQAGAHPHQEDYYFCEYDAPPDRDNYRERKWTADEATHFVVYETVTEGTPVTPAFQNADELVEYLATKGTFWDAGPWDRESAARFVASGWAPSAIARDGGTLKTVNEAGFYEPE